VSAETVLSVSEREALADLSDALLPAEGVMPSATQASVHTVGIDSVLAVRPDLVMPLRALLAEYLHYAPHVYLAALSQSRPREWMALLTCVLGAYYIRPEVRMALGYRGQEGRLITSADFVTWVEEGLLDPVIERGSRDPTSRHVNRPVPS
jgi:hypothetical protein